MGKLSSPRWMIHEIFCGSINSTLDDLALNFIIHDCQSSKIFHCLSHKNSSAQKFHIVFFTRGFFFSLLNSESEFAIVSSSWSQNESKTWNGGKLKFIAAWSWLFSLLVFTSCYQRFTWTTHESASTTILLIFVWELDVDGGQQNVECGMSKAIAWMIAIFIWKV